jgi:Kdo2-lipid IVA lauroyltransferase/acyltransferase
MVVATTWGARLLLAVMWLLHLLPLPLLAALGRGLGLLLYPLAAQRRKVALRNLALCFPEWSEAERRRLARAHFQWLGRSFLERSLLWFASPERLKKLIHVEGDVTLAERSERAVMWLVPHFMGLDVAGVAVLLFQNQYACSMYQQQSNPVMDDIIRKGRLRFGEKAEIFPRSDKALPLIRAIRKGHAFFNLPDMDFGARDAAFVPFFGVPAATLLAPSRMARALNMVVQPVVAEMLPGGQGYRVRFGEPFTDFPTDDAVADTTAMNRWIEGEIRRNPAQYLWVHKRFKTRPPGEAGFY